MGHCLKKTRDKGLKRITPCETGRVSSSLRKCDIKLILLIILVEFCREHNINIILKQVKF